MVEIRPAVPSDVDSIHDLGNVVPEFSVNEHTVNFWPKETLTQAIKSRDVKLLVASEDKATIGFILATYSEGLKKATVENIFVAPEFRGSGVSDMLLKDLVQNLIDEGCEYIATLIPEYANGAAGLYLRAGFSKGESFVWLDRVVSPRFEHTKQ